MTAGAESMERPAFTGAREGARGVAISFATDRTRLFAAARRRSGRVRFLRRAILISVVGSVAAMVAIAVFDPFGPKFGSLSFSNVAIDGTKIAMAKPRLAGFRADGQPYVLTAERALQDVRHPTVAELENLTGDIGATGGETTRITADTGVYDSAAGRMNLAGNVKISNQRFEVRLRTVDIDFKTGVYRSDEPIEVHVGANTTILADRASGEHNGQEMTFEGRVRTTLVPDGGAPIEAQTKESAP